MIENPNVRDDAWFLGRLDDPAQPYVVRRNGTIGWSYPTLREALAAARRMLEDHESPSITTGNGKIRLPPDQIVRLLTHVRR